MTEEDRDYSTARDREGRTFWFSLLSALGVLAVLGIILYAAQTSTPVNQGVQPGIGGGPESSPTATPSPTPSATPEPTTPPEEITPISTPASTMAPAN